MAFTMKTGDTSPILQATFTDASGSAVSIVGATVKLIVADLSNTVVMNKTMTVFDGSNGIAEYEWQSGDTSTSGTYKVEFEVTYATGEVETFPNTGYEMLVIKEDLA